MGQREGRIHHGRIAPTGPPQELPEKSNDHRYENQDQVGFEPMQGCQSDDARQHQANTRSRVSRNHAAAFQSLVLANRHARTVKQFQCMRKLTAHRPTPRIRRRLLTAAGEVNSRFGAEVCETEASKPNRFKLAGASTERSSVGTYLASGSTPMRLSGPAARAGLGGANGQQESKARSELLGA